MPHDDFNLRTLRESARERLLKAPFNDSLSVTSHLPPQDGLDASEEDGVPLYLTMLSELNI